MKRGIFSAHTPFSFATMAKSPFCTLPLSLGKLSLTPWPPIFSIERRDRMVSRAARSASALVDFEMSAPTGTDGHMMSLLSCTGRQICFGSAPRSHCDLPLQDTIPAFDRCAGNADFFSTLQPSCLADQFAVRRELKLSRARVCALPVDSP